MSVTATMGEAEESTSRGVLSRAKQVSPIYFAFILVFAWIAYLNPAFLQPSFALGAVQRAAPLIILAAGQYYVIVSGEFDLSVGSLVTVVVIVSSGYMQSDPSRLWTLLPILLVLGLVVGVVNGVVTTYLRVPSILATLGMLLILRGVAFQLSGGAPRGGLAENFRLLGRGAIADVPLIGRLPYAVFAVVVVAAVSWWLMNRTDFGPRLMAVGGTPRAAALSGIHVKREKIIAFVLSALSAIIAGVIVGGYAGITEQAGQGLELEAIAAVVFGGVLIGGGAGRVMEAIFGALTLRFVFTLLNLLGLELALRNTIQGLIIIGALAYAGLRFRQGES